MKRSPVPNHRLTLNHTGALPMEIVVRIAKSLIVGSLVGLAVALFSNFFFTPLFDRAEWLTYDMRYKWEFEEIGDKKDERMQESEYGIYIIDIDDRSQQKMGMYWHWNRSYHAKMLRTLGKNFPAATIFDVLFYDPEDQHHAERLDHLLQSADAANPDLDISGQLRTSITSSINYDQQFVSAARDLENVYFGIRMANLRNYPDYAHSTVKPKMELDWHASLKPSSALLLPPDIRKTEFNLSNEKPIIDGIFPDIANAARDIGYVNMVPSKDGTIRNLPVFFAFGKNRPVYLPISIRTAATLFGTHNQEIDFKPGKYVDIGKPFKIFRDSARGLSFSYPNVTVSQVKALLHFSSRILALQPGNSLEITSFTKMGKDEQGRFLEMYCGYFTDELVDILVQAPWEEFVVLEAGDSRQIREDVLITRDSDIEWILTAPYGDQEYYLSKLDLQTLSFLQKGLFDEVREGESHLLFHTLTVKNRGGKLISSIPVWREATLRQLCSTSWDVIEEILPGSRMEFGANVRIPLNKDNEHIITYFGRKGQPFPYYSYYDIMEDRVHGNLDGKVFIVGSTAPAMFDIKPVPHDNNFPGVEIHASLINSYLTNTFIRRLQEWHDFLILVLVGVFIGFLAFMLKPLASAIFSTISIFVYFLIAMHVFGAQHLWIEIARPVFTIIFTFTAVMAYRYITEEKDRKFLQMTFKQYLSPELIDQMYLQKQKPQLGGEEGVRTAYFTDIQSFSTFSEKLGSPTRLVELLNEYLTAMTDILLARFGTLDKYEGDAIIAFFGAPMPMEDHAQQACYTALEMQDRLGELRSKWISEGDKWPKIVHEMHMRIGVNTGAITTGNMGSAVRMNYTMMGDAVNLAARLESAAKQYGVYTMISHMTYDLIKDDFEVRQLDKIMVVGKSEPVVVYELLAKKGELRPDMKELIDIYQEGLAYFYAQDWEKAIALMTEGEKLEPNRPFVPKNMSPCKKIIEYCIDHQQNPPGADWDGVMRLTSK
ncbi:MAG: CHASE2 domain-containing protein [Chitinivibrionales bacterium]|nr:CHASE2 domain-containing protein [Chitinivibrionales bacterium]